MPLGIGHWELVALIIVALLLFGSSRLPQVARQLGKGAREARKEYLEVKHSFEAEEPREDGAESEQAAPRQPS